MGERGCLFEDNFLSSNRANDSSLANWPAGSDELSEVCSSGRTMQWFEADIPWPIHFF